MGYRQYVNKGWRGCVTSPIDPFQIVIICYIELSMNVNIQYFMVVSGKKQNVDPPDGFPSIINISEFAHLKPGVALARAMGEYIRKNGLDLPHGILFEKAP